MLEAYEITHLHTGDEFLEVVVTFEERQKSRYKTHTLCGKDIGWFIERGRVLSGHDALRCSDGTLIKISCAPEKVTRVTSTEALALTKAAYHLGNRHVALQVEAEYLQYQADYVLDDMVRGLGLTVSHEMAPFHPESGAYAGGHKHGADSHEHESSHEHKSSHDHDHSHSHHSH